MSGLGKLNLADFVKGAIVAVLGAVAGFIQQLIATGADISSINWKAVANVALGALVAYLAKNLLTDSHGAALGIAASTPAGAERVVQRLTGNVPIIRNASDLQKSLDKTVPPPLATETRYHPYTGEPMNPAEFDALVARMLQSDEPK